MISPLDKIVEYGCRLSPAMRHFKGFSCFPWKGLQMGGGKDLRKYIFNYFCFTARGQERSTKYVIVHLERDRSRHLSPVKLTPLTD